MTVGSGHRPDLRAIHIITSAQHTPLIVDGAQAVGVIPMDVRDPKMDFLACTASKWLFGPTGIGFLYVGDRFMHTTPPLAGWLAAENRSDWDLRHPVLYKDATRFQGGIPNLIGAAGALAGIHLVGQIGLEFIHQRVLALTEYLLEGLDAMKLDIWTPRGENEHAGIVFFRHLRAKALYEALKANRIYCGCFLGGIRLDCHVFNTFKELEITLDTIRTFVRSP